MRLFSAHYGNKLALNELMNTLMVCPVTVCLAVDCPGGADAAGRSGPMAGNARTADPNFPSPRHTLFGQRWNFRDQRPGVQGRLLVFPANTDSSVFDRCSCL
jgi:hypothetical protein